MNYQERCFLERHYVVNLTIREMIRTKLFESMSIARKLIKNTHSATNGFSSLYRWRDRANLWKSSQPFVVGQLIIACWTEKSIVEIMVTLFSQRNRKAHGCTFQRGFSPNSDGLLFMIWELAWRELFLFTKESGDLKSSFDQCGF